MPYAVELYLDATTEQLVRGLWRTLAEAGVSQAMLAEGFYPHITLGIANQLDSAALWPELSAMARRTCPQPVTLSHFGVFPNPEAVLFLGATVTRSLLDMHEAFSQLFEAYAQEPWGYYRPGHWVPHCTLALYLDPAGISQALNICLPVGLPIEARVEGLGVTEINPHQARTIYMHRLDQDPGA
jgi:2'-5' RNA ligase